MNHGLFAQESSKESISSPEISVVGEIEFQGNQLHKSRSLEKTIKTRRNHELNRRKVQNDVKLLFETGFFEDVTVSVESLGKKDKKGRNEVKVVFQVVERPIIKRIDYKGYKKIKPSSFEDKVQSKEGEPYDRFKVALDARSILEYYRDEGYAQANVEHYTTLDQKSKKLILTFFIEEGERVLVDRIDVEGLKRHDRKKVLHVMKTRRKKVFRSEVLSQDRQRIVDYFKTKGFIDVGVSTPNVSIDEEVNRARISFSVSKGIRYKTGDIHIATSSIFTPKQLKKALVLRSGKRYDKRKMDESITKLTSLFADKGYLRTEVNYDLKRHPEKSKVDVDIDFSESSVVYVDGIYVDGNTYTKTFVIKREVLLRPGDVFSAGRVRRSVEKIYNLGFLDDVQVDVQQPRDPNLADLIFTVKEGKPGILSAGAGFSSVDRFVGTLSVQHTNLFGRAQRLNVSYEFGARRQNFDVSWTDPWFLGYRMSGGVDFFNTIRRRDFPNNTDAFRERRRGLSARIGPRVTENLNLVFGYTVQSTEIFDVEDTIKEDLFPTFGISKEDALRTDSVTQIKSSFFTEMALDTRDNRFDASRGSRNALSVEVAGGPWGGDINYYKPQVSSSWFFPTFWKFVLSASGRFAWVNHFSPSRDVPTSERFFLGGADDVRGYSNNSIAPRTVQTDEAGIVEIKPVPGRILAVFNLEYKFPIVQEHNRTIFQGALFADAGGTWLDTNDVTLTTGRLDRRMKASVGFGFRFKTPVFPIRLDFAIPLNPRPSDPTRQGDSKSLQPHFTIGNIF